MIAIFIAVMMIFSTFAALITAVSIV